jgi:ubiquitin-conjugating enzyme E2 S
VGLTGSTCLVIRAVGTPYDEGSFRLKLVLSRDYPHSPPRAYFMTKIFHPNVATSGDVCVNMLKRDWNADLTVSHMLQVRTLNLGRGDTMC